MPEALTDAFREECEGFVLDRRHAQGAFGRLSEAEQMGFRTEVLDLLGSATETARRMRWCAECGRDLYPGAIRCPTCGCPTPLLESFQQTHPAPVRYPQWRRRDERAPFRLKAKARELFRWQQAHESPGPRQHAPFDPEGEGGLPRWAR